MAFKKGNKLGGRSKGAQNKEKKALRESLQSFLDENKTKFNRELQKLVGAQFIDRYIALLEFCTPKLNRTDLTNDGEEFDFNLSTDELINELKTIGQALNEKG